MLIRRGIVAALVFSALLSAPPLARAAAPASADKLAAGESTLSDGLTVAVRSATLSPTAALEVWIVSPSDGYGTPAPGIARLAALSVIATKVSGQSLRDVVRDDGGQLMVSVFPSSTEISVLAPANAADQLADALLARVLHPAIDAAGFRDAKLRLAEQQAVAASEPDVLLRDGIFSQLFSDGPFHASTYGGPDNLRTLSMADAATYATQAYVPGNEIVVVVGGGLDEDALNARIASAAPPAALGGSLPASTLARPSGTTYNAGFADAGGVALGWIGPSVSDERTSTAMDFISDYLTRPDYGLVAKAVADADPQADFNGQFITLRGAGVFYITVTGGKHSADAMAAVVRTAMKPLLDGPLPAQEFARALEAFRVHTLRDTQTPQELADNYGWYFAQGAPAYAPSVTDISLNGDYYSQAASLTAQTIYAAAKTYLGATPVTATVAPRPQAPATTSMLPGGRNPDREAR